MRLSPLDGLVLRLHPTSWAAVVAVTAQPNLSPSCPPPLSAPLTPAAPGPLACLLCWCADDDSKWLSASALTSPACTPAAATPSQAPQLLQPAGAHGVQGPEVATPPPALLSCAGWPSLLISILTITQFFVDGCRRGGP